MNGMLLAVGLSFVIGFGTATVGFRLRHNEVVAEIGAKPEASRTAPIRASSVMAESRCFEAVGGENTCR